MKFKGSTKPLLRRYSALLDKCEAAFQGVFDAALPRRDVGWQNCYRDYASAETRAAYDAAQHDVAEFEYLMAHNEHRGYFENGYFHWY